MSDCRSYYLSGYLNIMDKLHRLDAAGELESNEAEELRDESDSLWQHMPEEERCYARGYLESLR